MSQNYLPQPIPTRYIAVLQILCLLRQTIPLHNIMNPVLNYHYVLYSLCKQR